ncbi:cyclic nucleotide-binding domain-containing protein 2-like [Alosa alosa]|uniref:cyclic nucleotide-binding domain-containing protein 2-like n=1 Tax=Alosa alosa TaxID=278164 RepID=UPI002015243D|nr:cyclic nucleotide-binding domain-containing protein 2-like [Alosa alosa]
MMKKAGLQVLALRLGERKRLTNLCVLELFRQSVRSVMIMWRVCRIFMSRSNYSMHLNILENLNTQLAGVGKNLVFDLNHFKIKKNHIPLKLVEIMGKHPEHRSEQEVLLLLSLLITIDGFRRYSPTLQLLLSRVVRYQRGMRNAGKPHLIIEVKSDVVVVLSERVPTLPVSLTLLPSASRSLELVSSFSSPLIERLADHSKAELFRHGRIVVKDTNDMGNLIFVARGLCDVLRKVDLTKCKTYQRLLKKHQSAESSVKTVSPRQPEGVSSEKTSTHTHRGSPTPVKGPPVDLPTSAWFLIDSLLQGSTFGLNEYLIPHRQRDSRSLTLVSRSVEILRVDKTCFDELVDDETLKKLKDIQKTYPSDEELCTVLLRHQGWERFKVAVTMDVLAYCPQRDRGTMPTSHIRANHKPPAGQSTPGGRPT